MKIFTTLSPSEKSIETQLESSNSWINKGYTVYSINTPSEIERISNIYTDIIFIETNDTFDYNNKKLVKLNAILNAIDSICIEDEYVGITNSDIILNENIDLLFQTNSLTIVTRYELDNGSIYPFISGYDLFIFNSKNTNIFKSDDYVIGMPWWDYWLPIRAIQSNLTIMHISSQIIYHRTHATNYDNNIWIEFGLRMFNNLNKYNTNPNTNVNIFEFGKSIKRLIEETQNNYSI